MRKREAIRPCIFMRRACQRGKCGIDLPTEEPVETQDNHTPCKWQLVTYGDTADY
jgi:hypothetical protein